MIVLLVIFAVVIAGLAGFAFGEHLAARKIRALRRLLANEATGRRELEEKAGEAIKRAALLNYRSGYSDGVTELCARLRGETLEETKEIEGVFTGVLPGPLRRWLADVEARAQEHSPG